MTEELPKLWGDGFHDDTEALQARINKTAQDSGGDVVISDGEFLVSRTLVVPKNVTVHLDRCTVIASPDMADPKIG